MKFKIPKAPTYGHEIMKHLRDPRFDLPFWEVQHASEKNPNGPKMWVAVMDPENEAKKNWQKLLYLSHEYKDPDVNESLPLVLIKRNEMEIFRGVGFIVTFYAPASIRDHLVRYTTRWTMAAKGLRVSVGTDFYVPEGAKTEKLIKEYGTNALRSYKSLVENGERYQDARAVAPFNTMVRWTMGLSYMTLIYMFKDRNWLVGADPDTKRLIQMLWDIVHESHPELWDCIYEYFGPPTIYGNRAMRQLRERGVRFGGFLNAVIEDTDLGVEKPKLTAKKSGGGWILEIPDWLMHMPLWDLIMRRYGKPPKDTWNA